MVIETLRHAVLYGEYELSIDEKNRLLIPAEIRKSMTPDRDGEAFFLIVGVNRKPWLYPERYYEELITQPTPEITPAEDLLAFDQMNFAMANKIGWDKQGRCLIPDKTLRRTGTTRGEVTLIGARDHLELWNRPDWDARREELMAKSSEIALRAKQVRQQGQ
jgi:MraZ protein